MQLLLSSSAPVSALQIWWEDNEYWVVLSCGIITLAAFAAAIALAVSGGTV